jgi:dienelactone hydrolase
VALDLLRQQPNVDSTRIAAIGFCFGGTTVLELARSGADIACTVGFHAGVATTAPAQQGAIRGKVLVCQGADDPIITADQRSAFTAEMTSAGVDWQMHVYGGVGHSFTNPEIDKWNLAGFKYDARADRRSWQAMRALFEESLA